MKKQEIDLLISGAGPVGLMCAYLAQICGLKTTVLDQSKGPLAVGRADALNARTLQLLETVDLFKGLYKQGKKCNTSSVWKNGKFISRQSSWWTELEGCFHKHFLMIGQSYIEKLLDKKLREIDAPVMRETSLKDVQITEDSCLSTLSNGEKIKSKYVIGSDGSRSFIRNKFKIPFEITRPKIIWAVIDGVVETDFKKVPEIIVFQTKSSDVAWIPREGKIDRFYVRMDRKNFTIDEVLEKINRAITPHTLRFKEIEWFSQFTVKESVAENFSIKDRVFLAGDACHIHSVNGGQGLNTGLADAFNLIWKINMVTKHGAPTQLLQSYEHERKPVAKSVIESSGELVRSTKHSVTGTHALDYVKIVEKRSGNITGMGIRYGTEGLSGTRLHDFELFRGKEKTRIYSILDYTKFTLLVFSNQKLDIKVPKYVKVIQIFSKKSNTKLWSLHTPYKDQSILVRPDAYIHNAAAFEKNNFIIEDFLEKQPINHEL